jgi:hypothetical protein
MANIERITLRHHLHAVAMAAKAGMTDLCEPCDVGRMTQSGPSRPASQWLSMSPQSIVSVTVTDSPGAGT